MLLICIAQLHAAPATHPTTAPQSDIDHNAQTKAEFLAFDPNYKQKIHDRIAKATPLGMQVYIREKLGQNVQFSHQILSELIWLFECTADYPRIDQRLEDLRLSLQNSDQQKRAAEQDPADGTYGAGYTEWFFKLSASYDHAYDKNNAPFKFLDRINSPQALSEYLTRVCVSDIPRTGRNNYREFNESLSCLMRLILRNKPEGYSWHPKIKSALMDLLLKRFRNPQTGYWGPSYVRHGRVVFIDDLSITFHTISYLQGNVPDLDKVVTTTLAVKDLNYPVGWLYEGKYWNHNNMDVAELFDHGWAHASAVQRAQIAAEIDKMLQWCLNQSLQPDGSFAVNPADGSIEEGTYYGTSFLARIGFFEKSKRFWTDRGFPQAEEVRQRITRFIESHSKVGATGGNYYRNALRELEPPP